MQVVVDGFVQCSIISKNGRNERIALNTTQWYCSINFAVLLNIVESVLLSS